MHTIERTIGLFSDGSLYCVNIRCSGRVAELWRIRRKWRLTVEDSNHTIVGIPDDRIGATFDVIVRAARQIVKPVLVLDPAEPEVYVLDGKQVVVATVMLSKGPIYQSGGICWVRRGTHTMPLSVLELLEMANDRGLQDWELLPARRATMQDIDMAKVEAYLKLRLTL